jgi:hypothetical protein
VARGADHELIKNYIMFKWLFLGGLKMRTARFEPDSWVYYPLQALFIPREMGGLGRLPWTVLMASNGVILAYYSKKFPAFEEWCRDVSWIINPVKLRIDDLLLDAMINKDAATKFNDGTERHEAPIFGGAKEFLTSERFLDKERLVNSEKLKDEFKGTRWEEFGYGVSGELWLKQVLNQTTLLQSRELLFSTVMSKRMIGRAMLVKRSTVKPMIRRSRIRYVFPFVWTIDFGHLNI